jgi:hypothetical protein
MTAVSKGTRLEGMRRARWLAILMATCALAVAVPASASAQQYRPAAAPALVAHPASLTAVPKFIFHAGLAFGAFHHFIYLPFKAGKFTSGGFFSKAKAYIEAGVAALFVYHETKLALEDAQKNKVLKLLVSPLTLALTEFQKIESSIKGHKLDASSVSSATKSVSSIESEAKKYGSDVREAIPSAKQLATGSA